MAVTRFQDLIAWQKARALTVEVYRCTDEGRLAKDWGLRDQMRRASVSVMANLAEGFDRNRPLQFSHFVDIAKGFCAELQSHLIVASDVEYLPDAVFRELIQQAEEVNRILGGLQRNSDHRSRESGHVPRDSALRTRDS